MKSQNLLSIYAKWTADLMKADGVTPEQVTADLALAYFDEVGRRIEKMQTIYRTRHGAREAMRANILAMFAPDSNASP